MGICLEAFPQVSEQPFKIIAFDWDGTAVVDRHADAAPVADAVSDLLELEVFVVVITGTNFGNIDRQFTSLIKSPFKRHLFVCSNRGSEVYGFDLESNPYLLFRREATQHENLLLDRIAEAVKSDIERRSRVTIDIVYDRLNRRKIDLIPEWKDPPKSRIGELIEATQKRLVDGGFSGGLKSAFELSRRYAREFGLQDPRITSDVKHIEVGLTDKSDSIRWIAGELCRGRNIPFRDLLVGGDEFGPVAGFEGSDFHMVAGDITGATYISVGREPNGVPAGVNLMGGGPACFLEILKQQVRLQRELLPSRDAAEVLKETGYNHLREREVESLMSVGNGYLGTRGSLEGQAPASDAATLVAGVYDRISEESIEELAVVPDWVYTQVYAFEEKLATAPVSILRQVRTLDFKKGLFFREWRHRGRNNRVTSVRFLRFASLADPHALVERITIMPENYRGSISVETGLRICRDCMPGLEITGKLVHPNRNGLTVEARTRFTGITIVETQKSRVVPGFISAEHGSRVNDFDIVEDWSWIGDAGQIVTIEKFISIFTSRDGNNPLQAAHRHLRRLEGRGFNGLLRDHVAAWEERWRTAAITVAGDEEAQHSLNFAAYHLISAGNPGDGRVSVSARSLTGSIYKGHIFWDAEMYILPFFIYTHPPTARAMLMYRYHTLAGARRNAAAKGYRGALFAWESTGSGADMTPAAVLDPKGEIVPVLSGKLEHHIDAAVAYATWSYWNATGDDGFLLQAGAELMVETARFWESRVTQKGGVYHIDGVEGPDEYHDEDVNDNFYTNCAAACNLRRSARVIEYLKENHPIELARLQERIDLHMSEPDQWHRIAAGIYRDMETDSLIEQFAGYFSLEDIDIREFEPRSAPIDVVLGHKRTVASQVVKQADAVLALYLLEEEFTPEVIRQSFAYYDRRTAHGSSLSPSIYGLVAARLGLMEAAMRYFRLASRIDMTGGNAAGGIHVAALGGLWQQVIMGFAGVRIKREGISLFPHMPEKWQRLGFSLLWRKLRLEVEVENGRHVTVAVAGKGECSLGIHGRPLQAMAAGRKYVSLWSGETWEEFTPWQR